MNVRMLVTVSGTRDGADWPARGEILSCSEDEAASLIAAGLAEEGDEAIAPVAAPLTTGKAPTK